MILPIRAWPRPPSKNETVDAFDRGSSVAAARMTCRPRPCTDHRQDFLVLLADPRRRNDPAGEVQGQRRRSGARAGPAAALPPMMPPTAHLALAGHAGLGPGGRGLAHCQGRIRCGGRAQPRDRCHGTILTAAALRHMGTQSRRLTARSWPYAAQHPAERPRNRPQIRRGPPGRNSCGKGQRRD